MSASAEARIAKDVLAAARKIHAVLGPGLTDVAYQPVLVHELEKRGHTVQSHVPILIVYDGISFNAGFYADLVVDDLVIVHVRSNRAPQLSLQTTNQDLRTPLEQASRHPAQLRRRTARRRHPENRELRVAPAARTTRLRSSSQRSTNNRHRAHEVTTHELVRQSHRAIAQTSKIPVPTPVGASAVSMIPTVDFNDELDR